MTLLLSVAAFAIGWVWNTYLMAVGLDGSSVDPGTRTAATADGRAGNVLFWLLLFSLFGGLTTYAWSRGWRNFRTDLLELPRRFGQAMASGRSGAFAMLLWGMSVSLVISTLISSAVSLALGLVLVALATTPVGVILNFALIRFWRGLCGIVTPDVDARIAIVVGPFMVMMGEALGLVVDWMFGAWLVGLLLGVACAIASVLLVRGATPPRAAALLIAGTLVAGQFLWTRRAYADDGGWGECVTSDGQACSDAGFAGLFAWLSSPGAGHVMVRGSLGATFAAVGAVIGIGVGGAVAGLAVAAAQASGSIRRQRRPGTRDGRSRRPETAGEGQGYGSQAAGEGRVYRSEATGDGRGYGSEAAGAAGVGPPSDGLLPDRGERPVPQPSPSPAPPPTPPLGTDAPPPAAQHGSIEEDFLPEPPDRKRRKEDGEGSTGTPPSRPS